jgi:hypothetical protein
VIERVVSTISTIADAMEWEDATPWEFLTALEGVFVQVKAQCSLDERKNIAKEMRSRAQGRPAKANQVAAGSEVTISGYKHLN